MIPWGPWHPDSAAINTPVLREARNCVPHSVGFAPLRAPAPATGALNDVCRGAGFVTVNNGQSTAIAGTQTKLYKLGGAATWTDVSRVAGGAYSVGPSEYWAIIAWGTQAVAFNVSSAPQIIDVVSGSNFADLTGAAFGAAPPQARHAAVVRDFAMVGNTFGNARRVQWCGINDINDWRIGGPQQSDVQDALSGGPVMGIIGGEVAYVFQTDRVTRMTYVPGSAAVFQVDEVQGTRGMKASRSLVRLGRDAYYLAPDGFYHFDTGAGSAQPLGVRKWNRYFMDDVKPGAEQFVQGGIDPINRRIFWAYKSKSLTALSDTAPNRMLIYDWVYDEATFADISIESMVGWVTQGVTLDTMNSYGNLDTLPFSLDSPFWKGGANIFGVFTPDHKLSFLQGDTLAATFITADGQQDRRQVITGTRPSVDAAGATVAIAMRERDADVISFDTAEAMEDTGVCPAHISGNIARATMTIPAAEAWTVAKGLETMARPEGRR